MPIAPLFDQALPHRTPRYSAPGLARPGSAPPLDPATTGRRALKKSPLPA